MRIRSSIVVFSLLFAAGCGAKWIDYAASSTLGAAAKPRAPELVRVFAGPVTCPYEELGLMENKQWGFSWWRSLAQVVDAMRRTAGAHGADAVILSGHTDRHAGQHAYLGVAIRFRGQCPASLTSPGR